ncbi:hypothetical protein Gotri_011669 [Gossypium trilobum]|uniref:DUF4283 domain-containing protein n=1 Tax=Gossypium trilobum TaxID=34281 RepID=A0A7J9EUJ2_9ROSI|nr:hypothetical protein [Gossypium trilobum]
MSTFGIIEDNDDCPVDGRNTKIVWFKDKGIGSVEMLVDSISASTLSWKDMLLGNSVESSKETGKDGGEIFDFVGDFTSKEDFEKVLTEEPWIVFGQYHTVYLWALDSNLVQPFPIVIMAWVGMDSTPRPSQLSV